MKFVGVYLAFLMQSLIFEKINIMSASFDILAVAIIICSVSSKPLTAMLLGIFAGSLLDALCGQIFGINILVYMSLAVLVSVCVNEKTQNSPLLMSWVVFVALTSLEIAAMLFKTMFGYGVSLGFTGANILVKGMFGFVFTLLFVLGYQNLKERKTIKKDSCKEAEI